ncbi:cytochrome P450, putative [Talaromyces stipitatus ATCC 10500]|uniref:Cytochrome P450, putative n=1 Tax=Talaromyces stipitatus (strain ATCC 10500 / CBS 375.48 / QM 6759 / NRRL 1006) TaxID=441959 RepID=B8MGJ0_TALSN|nr:cytochrome P450, putative [Talaromyces stipitatus ATCC 10500]EED16741.1 cytochrome P450, putative [Talaromyces stipitatus ATCC 10500]
MPPKHYYQSERLIGWGLLKENFHNSRKKKILTAERVRFEEYGYTFSSTLTWVFGERRHSSHSLGREFSAPMEHNGSIDAVCCDQALRDLRSQILIYLRDMSENFSVLFLTINRCRAFVDTFDYAQRGLIDRTPYGAFLPLYRNKHFDTSVRICHQWMDNFVHKNLEYRAQARHGKQSDGYNVLEELSRKSRSAKDLRDQLLCVLLAGRDTTAGLISNVFYFLACHKSVSQHLQSEVASLQGCPPSLEEIKQMKYLSNVMNECLRLYPLEHSNVRIANIDTILPVGGGPGSESPPLIGKGQIVMYNVYSMHRRKEIYGLDADYFRPERWEKPRLGWVFLPFNRGPRICIGLELELQMIESRRLERRPLACKAYDVEILRDILRSFEVGRHPNNESWLLYRGKCILDGFTRRPAMSNIMCVHFPREHNITICIKLTGQEVSIFACLMAPVILSPTTTRYRYFASKSQQGAHSGRPETLNWWPEVALESPVKVMHTAHGESDCHTDLSHTETFENHRMDLEARLVKDIYRHIAKEKRSPYLTSSRIVVNGNVGPLALPQKFTRTRASEGTANCVHTDDEEPSNIKCLALPPQQRNAAPGPICHWHILKNDSGLELLREVRVRVSLMCMKPSLGPMIIGIQG